MNEMKERVLGIDNVQAGKHALPGVRCLANRVFLCAAFNELQSPAMHHMRACAW
jgi:hypothetical protein